MTNAERAKNTLQQLKTRAVWESDKIALLAAAFDEVERGALERASAAPVPDLFDASPKFEGGYVLGVTQKIAAIRALIPEPAAQSSIEYQQQRGSAWDIIDQAINAYDQWMLDDDYDAKRILDEIIDNLRKRRDLYRSPDPAAPDPTKALARIFANGIKTGNAGYLFVRQLARDNGLLDGEPLWQEPVPLTDLGRAAITLAGDGG